MLGNSTEKKMVFISSTTNEWPQNEHQGMNMSSAGTRAMDKQTQQQQITQESLKCPRCDSSNTKFCYYNNYSLSQPRHFCKACKRYWTRGGTLRNVPVGGGCRRNNKKIRRSISAIDLPPSSSSSPAAMSINPNTTHSQINPVFFGFPTNPNSNSNSNSEMGTLTYPSFNPRDSSAEVVLGFEPQMSGFGLGFSNHDGNYQNGTTNSLLSSYSLFGSSTNSPTIASLLGSNLNQQKFINNVNGGFQGLGSFEEMQMGGNASRKVKREEGQTYQNPNIQNHLEQTNPSDSSLYWNATNFGTWLDPTTIGSSVPSLI